MLYLKLLSNPKGKVWSFMAFLFTGMNLLKKITCLLKINQNEDRLETIPVISYRLTFFL